MSTPSDRRSRPPIVGPVILIGIGILALLNNYGQLPSNFWVHIWRLWPLFLVLVGVEILIGQMALPRAVSFLLALVIIIASLAGIVYLATLSPEKGSLTSEETQHVEKDLQGATSARVSIDYGVGQLKVSTTGGNAIMVGDLRRAGSHPGADVSYTVAGGRGDLQITLADERFGTVFLGGWGNEWDVRLNNSIPIELHVKAGASTNELDLTDLKLTELRFEGGMSTTTLRLPKTGNYAARIQAGMSTVNIYVPEGVGARVRLEGGLSAFNVDEGRFLRSGDDWVTKDYETATHKASVIMQGGLSTVTVR